MTRHRTSPFEERYGIHRNDFAEQECVTPASISMRLRNFGTPYQRKSMPSRYERKYGRTLYEIAEERGLHPATIETHERTHSNAWHHNAWHHKTKHQTISARATPHWRDQIQGGKYWSLQCTWLHPLHPDYDRWREGKLFPDEHVGGSSLTASQVDQMMRQLGWSKY